MEWRSAFGALLAVTLGIAVVYSLYYRAAWHDWPWQGDPASMSMCGRDFAAGPGSVESARQMRQDGFDVHRLYPVFRAPPMVGSQVYSDVSPAQRAQINRQPGEGCGGSLVIVDSPGRYRVYRLEGGP
jgi:hypothetical protein